jgi:hypothetical protein
MTTAPDYLTWTGDVANGVNPYRPAVVDMGGLDKENDANYPPSPNEPSAEEWNQIVAQVAAFAMVAPAAVIDVRFSGGVPTVYAIYGANPGLVIADVTVTDLGAGIVTLAIPATKIPDVRWGKLNCQATGNFGGVAYRSAAQTLRCEIYDADSGAASDTNFVAEWG